MQRHLGVHVYASNDGGWLALAAQPQRWELRARFGTANRVTLARAIAACLLGGFAIAGGPLREDGASWGLVAIATTIALLDYADGWIARHAGEATRFGARFDMETDALFIIVLAILVWRLDQTGAWILAAGGMRYGFVAAAFVWPRLGASLPPSRRRKAVCAAQMAALIICLAPIVTPVGATIIGAASVSVLAWSFAIDILWLTGIGTRKGPWKA